MTGNPPRRRRSSRNTVSLWTTARPTPAFWVLAPLLILVFLTGGSARPEVMSLMVLRPAAVLAAGFALATLRLEHVKTHWPLLAFLAGMLALVIAHLVPLPPDVWQQLPGRDLIVEIDRLIGLQDQWRPLSMVPDGTWNALYALAIPVAVVLLAIQLPAEDHLKILLLLIGLTLVSGLLGVLQASGQEIILYRVASETPGLFANRNHQGALVALLFPMLFAAIMLAPRIAPEPRAIRIVAFALMLAAIPLVIVTGSRAGLGLAAFAILCIPIVRLGLGTKNAEKTGTLVKATAWSLGTVAVAAMVWLTMFLSRDIAITRLDSDADELRFPVWASIWERLPDFLPWGTGVGSYVQVYQTIEPASMLRPRYSNHAHNDWLEVLLTAGVPGAVFLGLATLLVIIAAWKSARRKLETSALDRAGLLMLIILAFASATDYPLRTPILAGVFALAAVWASGVRRTTVKHERQAS